MGSHAEGLDQNDVSLSTSLFVKVRERVALLAGIRFMVAPAKVQTMSSSVQLHQIETLCQNSGSPILNRHQSGIKHGSIRIVRLVNISQSPLFAPQCHSHQPVGS